MGEGLQPVSQKLGSSLLRQASERQISSLRWAPGAAFRNPWKPDPPCPSGFLPHDLVMGGISCAGSRQQLRWPGIPTSLRIFQFVVIHTVKGFCVVNKAEVDVFLELSCFFSIWIEWEIAMLNSICRVTVMKSRRDWAPKPRLFSIFSYSSENSSNRVTLTC